MGEVVATVREVRRLIERLDEHASAIANLTRVLESEGIEVYVDIDTDGKDGERVVAMLATKNGGADVAS